MSYMHLSNLYKDTSILLFKKVWALEKIHGTSAHVKWKAPVGEQPGSLHLFSGEQQANFEALFEPDLAARLAAYGGDITVYGEAYGGKIQKQAVRYGAELRFIAFDVCRNGRWLCVPEAASFALSLDLQFVHYIRSSTDISALDALRDAPSVQAARNGMGEHTAEGIVLHPLIELQNWRGERVMAKHKRDDFRETFQPRKVGATIEVLQDATRIAEEWVTPMRLAHVLQKIPSANIESTSDIIGAMIEDVCREGAGEFIETREARKAIAAKTAIMFKDSLRP